MAKSRTHAAAALPAIREMERDRIRRLIEEAKTDDDRAYWTRRLDEIR